MDAVRAEWCKLRTTAVPWVMGGIALALAALEGIVLFLSRGSQNDGTFLSPGYDYPHTTAQLRNLLGVGVSGYLLALLMGTLVVTTEFRHKTITTTLLVTPRRERVVAAKFATGALVGAAMALVVVAITLIGGVVALAALGGPVGDLLRQIPAVVPALVLVYALGAVIGVGVGSILTNQVAAIIVVLGWFLILESILVALVHGAERWVPSGAASALASVTTGRNHTYGLLTWWQGALVLLGYGVVFAVLGVLLLERRDIS
jgi:ABC-type transport system involved in multi-copper enzyme maturation permease subunit